MTHTHEHNLGAFNGLGTMRPRELHLRYLYEAAKLGSMRAAGEHLGVAASSVSRQIAQIEAEIGVHLIEHGRRNIVLTEAGRVLITHFSQQLRLQETLDAQLADIRGLRTGRIDLAVGEGFVGDPLSQLLERFNTKNPGVFISVHMSASSNEVARLVAEDDVHLGLVFQSSGDPRIRVLASVSQPLCAVMRLDHPLASHRRLKLLDFKPHRMCLLESSFRTRELLRAAEAVEGITLQPSIGCNSIALLKSLLEAGDFLTLLPLLAVGKEIETRQFAAVPIDNSALDGAAVQLIARKGRRLPPAPSRMVSSLTKYLGAHGSAPRASAAAGLAFAST